jgi:hypothetical protein
MQVTKKDTPKRVLESFKDNEITVNVVLSAPNEQLVRTAMRQAKIPCGIEVTIMGPVVFIGAHNADNGVVIVDGVIESRKIQFESITSVKADQTGTYSFIGVEHEMYSWERNYNAGTQCDHTWTTYKIIVKKKGSATYEVKETKTRE